MNTNTDTTVKVYQRRIRTGTTTRSDYTGRLYAHTYRVGYTTPGKPEWFRSYNI